MKTKQVKDDAGKVRTTHIPHLKCPSCGELVPTQELWRYVMPLLVTIQQAKAQLETAEPYLDGMTASAIRFYNKVWKLCDRTLAKWGG